MNCLKSQDSFSGINSTDFSTFYSIKRKYDLHRSTKKNEAAVKIEYSTIKLWAIHCIYFYNFSSYWLFIVLISFINLNKHIFPAEFICFENSYAKNKLTRRKKLTLRNVTLNKFMLNWNLFPTKQIQ